MHSEKLIKSLAIKLSDDRDPWIEVEPRQAAAVMEPVLEAVRGLVSDFYILKDQAPRTRLLHGHLCGD